MANKAVHHHILVGRGGEKITGGYDTTPLERVVLDLAEQVRRNIEAWRSVEPPRYDLENFQAQRDTGRTDTLLKVYMMLSGNHADQGLVLATSLLALDGEASEARILAEWKPRWLPTGSPGSAPAWTLRTLHTGEDERLLALRSGALPTPPNSAAADAAAEAQATEFLQGLADELCAPGQCLELGVSSVAVISSTGDEVEVHDTASFEGVAAAVETLIPSLGEGITFRPR